MEGGRLLVEVIEARNLISNKGGKPPSLYCSVDVHGSSVDKKNINSSPVYTVLEKSNEPHWDQSFYFDIVHPKISYDLIITLYAKRVFQDTLIGQAIIPFEPLHLTDDPIWNTLSIVASPGSAFNEDFSVAKKGARHTTVAGEICYKLNFVRHLDRTRSSSLGKSRDRSASEDLDDPEKEKRKIELMGSAVNVKGLTWSTDSMPRKGSDAKPVRAPITKEKSGPISTTDNEATTEREVRNSDESSPRLTSSDQDPSKKRTALRINKISDKMSSLDDMQSKFRLKIREKSRSVLLTSIDFEDGEFSSSRAAATETKSDAQMLEDMMSRVREEEKKVAESKFNSEELENERKIMHDDFLALNQKLATQINELTAKIEKKVTKTDFTSVCVDVVQISEKCDNLDKNLKLLMSEYEEKQRIFDEQTTIKRNPETRMFYDTVRLKFAEIFIACKAITSGMITRANDNVDKALSGVQLLGSFVPLPFAGTVASIIEFAGKTIHGMMEEDKIKEVSAMSLNFAAIDHISEEVARNLTKIYKKQILSLSPDGAKTLAECAVKRITGDLMSGQIKADPLDKDDLKQIVTQMVVSVRINTTKQGIIPLKSQHVATKNIAFDKNWTDEGIFRKTGVKTETGKLYAGLRSDKYGYRLGTEAEALELHLTEATTTNTTTSTTVTATATATPNTPARVTATVTSGANTTTATATATGTGTAIATATATTSGTTTAVAAVASASLTKQVLNMQLQNNQQQDQVELLKQMLVNEQNQRAAEAERMNKEMTSMRQMIQQLIQLNMKGPSGSSADSNFTPQ